MPRSPLRLKRREHFLAVARAGRRVPADGFAMQAMARADGGPVRVGYTATRKLGNSVVRNRARRRLREVARLALGERALAGLDIVLLGRPATRTLPFPRLLAEFHRALDRLDQYGPWRSRGADRQGHEIDRENQGGP
ncbi:MAG: ribonuclease P protein component [Acetobacteraceae bacterium]